MTLKMISRRAKQCFGVDFDPIMMKNASANFPELVPNMHLLDASKPEVVAAAIGTGKVDVIFIDLAGTASAGWLTPIVEAHTQAFQPRLIVLKVRQARRPMPAERAQPLSRSSHGASAPLTSCIRSTRSTLTPPPWHPPPVIRLYRCPSSSRQSLNWRKQLDQGKGGDEVKASLAHLPAQQHQRKRAMHQHQQPGGLSKVAEEEKAQAQGKGKGQQEGGAPVPPHRPRHQQPQQQPQQPPPPPPPPPAPSASCSGATSGAGGAVHSVALIALGVAIGLALARR